MDLICIIFSWEVNYFRIRILGEISSFDIYSARLFFKEFSMNFFVKKYKHCNAIKVRDAVDNVLSVKFFTEVSGFIAPVH